MGDGDYAKRGRDAATGAEVTRYPAEAREDFLSGRSDGGSTVDFVSRRRG